MSFKAYLQLVRFPAVFTAMADIVLGSALAHGAQGQIWAHPFWLLVLSSSALYLSGMALNDVFDSEIDARERPGRPIPSGRVTIVAAASLGFTLLVLGLVLAAGAGGTSLRVAGFLAICVVAYDSQLKQTVLGPPCMGACRFLNVILGASLAGGDLWSGPPVWVAGALAVYITGLTWFARHEAGNAKSREMLAAVCVIDGGLLALMYLVSLPELSVGGSSLQLMFALAVVALTINRRVIRAVKQPEPQVVQGAVRLMLLSIVILDAILVFAASGDTLLAAATACLLVPSILIGRWLYMT